MSSQMFKVGHDSLWETRQCAAVWVLRGPVHVLSPDPKRFVAF